MELPQRLILNRIELRTWSNEVRVQPRDVNQVELRVDIGICEGNVLLKAELSGFNVDCEEHR